jgi:hypothetical protein
MGEDGTLKEFAGTLVEISSMNQKKKIGEDNEDNKILLPEEDD